MANNSTVDIIGIAEIRVEVPQGERTIEVYILPMTSHPLILGTEYLKSQNVVLDFSNFTYNFKTAKVIAGKRLTKK